MRNPENCAYAQQLCGQWFCELLNTVCANVPDWKCNDENEEVNEDVEDNVED